MSTTSRPAGALRVLSAALACAAVLTGCGGGDDAADGSKDAAKAAAASSSRAQEPDLASGLLTAEAFGPDAVVAAVSAADLKKGAGLTAQLGDIQVTPEDCAGAVERSQPDLADFDDVVGVSSTVGSTVTVEVLTRGGPIEGAIGDLASAVERCPQAEISSPEIGSATITFEVLPVPDLGDGSAALRYTTVVGLPDGTQAAVPALLGGVQDGDRLVILTMLSLEPIAPGAPALDAAAFAALLEQAYETQADALD